MIHIVNTKINYFNDFTEVIVYKREFTKGASDYAFNRQRKFGMVDGALSPLQCDIDEYTLQRTKYKSIIQTKDRFYGYALSNDWKYFCTLTVAKNDYDSEDKDIKDYWRAFRRKLQSMFRNIKMLVAVGRQGNGVMHFHILLGECNLDDYLTEYKVRNKRRVYSLPFWDKGLNEVSKIKRNDIEHIANYMVSNFTDINKAIYNKRRYYHTKNLNYKKQRYTFIGIDGIRKLMAQVESGEVLLHKKRKDRYLIFRKYNKQNGD